MKSRVTITISRKDIAAIHRVLSDALEECCGCHRPGEGSGYLGHDRTCAVHICRASFKCVEAFLTRANVRMRAKVGKRERSSHLLKWIGPSGPTATQTNTTRKEKQQ